MSIAGILSSSALTHANVLQNNFKQKQTEFQQLAQALQSGNLSSAQQAFGAASQNTSSSTAIQNTQLGQDFSTLGADLQSGNLTAAQKSYSALQQDVQNATSNGQVHHHHHHDHGGRVAHTPLIARFIGSNPGPSDNAQVAQSPIFTARAGLDASA